MASMKVKVGARIKDIVGTGAKFQAAYAHIMQSPLLAALIGQAIRDNFDQQGPNWAPLKAATVRSSVSKKIKKSIADMTDKELEAYEETARKARNAGDKTAPRQNRLILQKTGLLRKTASQVGFSGSSSSKPSKRGKKAGKAGKTVSGSNIYRVDGYDIVWGSSLSYADRQNKTRPFLVIRPEWNAKITALVKKQVAEAMSKIFGGGK